MTTIPDVRRPLAGSSPAIAVDAVPDIRAYTILEAAQLLGVSKHYVYTRIQDGEIKATDLGEGRTKYRVTAAELRRFLNSRTEPAA